MSTLSQLNYIFNRKQKMELFILWIVVVIGAFLELLGVSVVMPFTQIALDSSVIHTNKYYSMLYRLLGMNSDSQFIIMVIIVIICIYIVKNVYLIFMCDMQNRFSYNNQGKLANRLMQGYLSRDYLFHSMNNISELYRNVTTDSQMLFALVQNCLQLLTEVFVCLALFIYLLIVDVKVTLALSVFLGLFSGIFIMIFRKPTKKMGLVKRDTDAQMDKWVRQSFEGIKEVKILNRESFFLDKVSVYYKNLMISLRKIVVINYIPKPIFETACICIFMIVVAIEIGNGADIAKFVPTLTAFVIAAFRLLPSFSRLTTQFNAIVYNKTSLNEVYKDLKEIDDTLMQSVFLEEKSAKKMKLDETIEIRNVSFCYPNCETNVIEHADFLIPVNASVALIGASGAGKTTMADLVLGILKPQEGVIYSDQVDINSDICAWQRNLGYIPQSIYLIDDTIRNNILFGIPECEADETALNRALEKAQLLEFVESLEKGLDTVVGEHGVRLSGGQRQRIGIARALYNDPNVLVLDEATSALDNDTETAVMEAINGLQGKITMLIIAHRLTTIRNCDFIYEVKDGKVLPVEKTELFS